MPKCLLRKAKVKLGLQKILTSLNQNSLPKIPFRLDDFKADLPKQQSICDQRFKNIKSHCSVGLLSPVVPRAVSRTAGARANSAPLHPGNPGALPFDCERRATTVRGRDRRTLKSTEPAKRPGAAAAASASRRAQVAAQHPLRPGRFSPRRPTQHGRASRRRHPGRRDNRATS